MIYYLLYVSHTDNTFSQGELELLLNESRTNNKKFEITGMLIYLKNQFIQILEGEKETVLNLYHKITQDQRHHKVSKLLSGEHEHRNFNSWSMAFQNNTTDDLDHLNSFRELSDLFNSPDIKDHKHPAVLFLKLFHGKNNK
ncbi:MAG: BLUF domain-containing protein [Cyclobacteriaceae bacterium]